MPKAPTGIRGLDQITRGGLPRGRCTLITGGAGCGKTLLGLQFLVAGAREYGEPGVLVTFEESVEEVTADVASLGFDLDGLQRDGLLVIYAFRAEPAEVARAWPSDSSPSQERARPEPGLPYILMRPHLLTDAPHLTAITTRPYRIPAGWTAASARAAPSRSGPMPGPGS